MSSAELNRKKLDLISWINQLSDVKIITFLEDLRKSSTKDDWWDELSEKQKNIVLMGLKDAENGNLFSSSEFWKKIKDA
jgi:hypothetical protein